MCQHCELNPTLLNFFPRKQLEFPPVPPSIKTPEGTNLALGRLLGQGGFGRVYSASDHSGKVFALKVMSRAVIAQEAATGLYLEKEITTHASMGSHPHIVPFVSSFMTPSLLFMQMAYLPNGSLQDLLAARYRLTEVELRYWLTQLIGAVHHCHAKNTIHRDIKAANIVLDANMNIQLTDFGISAKLSSKLDRRSTWVGSPDFTAPEVVGGSQNGHSLEADVWGLGAFLLFALSGNRPFYAPDTELVYERIKKGDYTAPNDLSNECHALIKSILVIDPAKRPTLVTLMEDPFFNLTPFPSSIPAMAMRTNPAPWIPKIDFTPEQSKKNFNNIKKIAKVPVRPPSPRPPVKVRSPKVEVEVVIPVPKKRAPLGDKSTKAKNKVVSSGSGSEKKKVPIPAKKKAVVTPKPVAAIVVQRPKTRSQTKKDELEAQAKVKVGAVGAGAGRKVVPRVEALKEEARGMRMR